MMDTKGIEIKLEVNFVFVIRIARHSFANTSCAKVLALAQTTELVHTRIIRLKL